MATNYDPVKVTSSFASRNPTIGTVDCKDGAIDGEFLSTARDNPNWTREHDQAGNTTRVRNHNKGGVIPLTIGAHSQLNAVLQRAVNTDEQTADALGTLTIEDLNGTTTIIAQDAFPEGPPDRRFAATRGEVTWNFQCGSIDIQHGGLDEV